MINTIDPILVPIDDGANIIGVKRTKFYSIVNEGLIPIVKIGRKSLVSVESLRAYVASISHTAA
jgi:excisionase family DNA binding protein